MSQMNFVTRFVAYLPDDGDRGRNELAHATSRIAELGLDTLKHDNYMLAVAAPVPPPRTVQATMLLDVFPGTAASARLAAANFVNTESPEDVHRKAEQSAQCYNLLQFSDTGFSIESDALGLKPVYIARTPGGNVMGSRIADLLHLFPALAEPADIVALYELMIFRAPLAERTLHQRIRRTVSGGCYRWAPAAGVSVRRDRAIRVAPVDPLRFMDQTMEAIRDIAGQSLRDKTAGVAEPVIMALSGGFDSRLIAALCHDHQIRIRALSYGRRQHEEWHSARAVARALGLELEMIRYHPDNTLRHLDYHLETVEGTADPATSSIMNLFEASSSPGSLMLNGFAGDVLAGGHLGHHRASDYTSHESLADGVLHFYRLAARPELRELFTPAVDLDEVRQDVCSGLRTDCPPHQSYQLWDFEDRGRRFVGAQFPLLGEHFDTTMPFYDQRFFDIWTSIPPIALVGRNVFRRLLSRYYPALARIPHPEEPAPITPNLRWQLGRFYRSLPQRTLAGTMGAERTKNVFLRLYRHDYIWSLGNLAAPQQRARMLSRVTALRPVLNDVLGVALSPGYETTLSANVQALRCMWLAAEYAQYRAHAGSR